MRMVKVVLGVFILFVGLYFFVNVKEMTPTPYGLEEQDKPLFVQKISSKLSSKRPNPVNQTKPKSLLDAELESPEPFLSNISNNSPNEEALVNSETEALPTDTLDPIESEIEELDTMTEEDIDKLEVYFDGVEKNWKKRMSDFMMNELGLSVEKQEEYDRLKDEYEEEKISVMEDFHEYMEDKYGEGYIVEPNQEQEYFQNKIKGNYFEKLKDVFGEEGFDRYLEHLGDYNQKITEEQDPEHGVFLIEI